MADLTTLSRVKPWVGVANSTTTDDTLLTRLISAASRAILAYIARPFIFKKTYTQVLNGVGGNQLMLIPFPVLSVASVKIDGNLVPPAVGATGLGWILNAWDGSIPGGHQMIQLRGYCFTAGIGNVEITFNAGYAIQNEAANVPATPGPYTVTPAQPYGFWAQDDGVTYANGTALTKVASNPAAGQYSVDTAGTYTFNSADQGAAILLNYSFTPPDLENACIEIVGELYRYKDRIGTVSKTLGGQETMSYSQKDIPAFVKLSLEPYMRVAL